MADMDDISPRSKRRKGGSGNGNENGGHGDPPARSARTARTSTESELLANALEALHKGEFNHRLRPRDVSDDRSFRQDEATVRLEQAEVVVR